ncbi:hypothetical protein OIU78_021046 [Salix suchowensis]|nr:hypothetical protein OIU78_021046 [Salix suchowensis]
MLDHGIVCDGGKEITELQHELYRRTLSQNLDRHATAVLQGAPTVEKALERSKQGQNTSNEEADINANQDRLSRFLKMMEIDDLQASSDLPLTPLSIKVLSVLTHNISSTKYDLGKNPGLSVLDTCQIQLKRSCL